MKTQPPLPSAVLNARADAAARQLLTRAFRGWMATQATPVLATQAVRHGSLAAGALGSGLDTEVLGHGHGSRFFKSAGSPTSP